MDPLETISPVDGRYKRYTEPLATIFSEKGLINYRIRVEGEYLLSLSEHPQIGTRTFSEEEKKIVRRLYEMSTDDARIVKLIETTGDAKRKPTNHDVKAVEYFMKDKLKETSLEDSLEWIHFGLTSEDANNLAYGLMLSDSIGNIIIPAIQQLYETIEALAQQYKNTPMLARTHGQPASPTTFGKEFKIFSSRIKKQLHQLENYSIQVKLNGATGNYNAHYVAYPQVDWRAFTQTFIERFNDKRKIKLTPNLITTQIEPHDTYAEVFDTVRRINTIVINFDQDMWRYISDDWIQQKPVDGEIGSSTMPHKVNPIDFENSEGNLGIANAFATYFATKLPISRLQRDLSDSTVERNFGVALAHSLIGYKTAQKGLTKMAVNEQKVIKELEHHPEVISEAIQTVLRRENETMPYELLKELTRGRKPTLDDFRTFIDELDILEPIKEELRQITPTNYTGIAKLLVENE